MTNTSSTASKSGEVPELMNNPILLVAFRVQVTDSIFKQPRLALIAVPLPDLCQYFAMEGPPNV